ncbi:hypothetical protein [Plantibacter sp. RU18]|uniref:hypothetical protein n=1 Tax=Plantibacter sp. RU18 TaxID=3158143 RepID=UPI003D35EB58
MIDALSDFTSSFAPAWQWLAVMIVGAIPFVESYGGSALGVIAGVQPVIAIAAAIVGNIISMLVVVLGAHTARAKIVGEKASAELSPRRMRLRARFDKYGVAGVSLLGQTLLPSQITSAAMVSFGAPKNTVIVWQIISIILWGIAFGVLATLGVYLVK